MNRTTGVGVGWGWWQVHTSYRCWVSVVTSEKRIQAKFSVRITRVREEFACK